MRDVTRLRYLFDSLAHPFRWFTQIPFTVPAWLDKLAVRVAVRLRRKGVPR